jgi:hypothetical protein
LQSKTRKSPGDVVAESPSPSKNRFEPI